MRRRTKEGRNNSDEKNKSKNIREEGGIHMGTKTITKKRQLRLKEH